MQSDCLFFFVLSNLIDNAIEAIDEFAFLEGKVISFFSL